MCTNYTPIKRDALIASFQTSAPLSSDWPDDVYQDYVAPIIRSVGGQREACLATFGLVPKVHMQPGVRLSTLNARAETIAQKPTYARAWKAGQLCLVPMKAFYEPCWETGVHVRWRIGMADDSDFAVAGLWREWPEEDGGVAIAFTLITINADEHAVMKRFHRAEDEKRSIVVIRPDEYDDWLNCSNMELARSFLRLYPAELMKAEAVAKKENAKAKENPQGDLF